MDKKCSCRLSAAACTAWKHFWIPGGAGDAQLRRFSFSARFHSRSSYEHICASGCGDLNYLSIEGDLSCQLITNYCFVATSRSHFYMDPIIQITSGSVSLLHLDRNTYVLLFRHIFKQMELVVILDLRVIN